MFTKTITAVSLLAMSAFTSAAPAKEARQSSVSVTFYGAADAAYSLSVPETGVFYPTNNVLSISHYSTSGGPCVFFGVDGLILNTPAEGGYGDVGPPQTIVGGYCY